MSMDGLAGTEHIRSLPPLADRVPILAMSHVLSQQVVRFRDAGPGDHVGKPFKGEELYEIVARWRRGGRAVS